LFILSCCPAAAAQGAALPDRDCTDAARLLTRGCPTLELSGVYLEGAWDFHSHPPSRIAGGAAAIALAVRDGWGVAIELLGVHVGQEPSNAFLGGSSVLFRKRLSERRGLTFFVEGGLGASYATREVPDRGTRFNYLVQAGGGVSRRLGRGIGAMLDARFLHLSNLSLNGPDHNPDIQTLGGHAGIIIWF
jgi:hypothetical protein